VWLSGTSPCDVLRTPGVPLARPFRIFRPLIRHLAELLHVDSALTFARGHSGLTLLCRIPNFSAKAFKWFDSKSDPLSVLYTSGAPNVPNMPDLTCYSVISSITTFDLIRRFVLTMPCGGYHWPALLRALSVHWV